MPFPVAKLGYLALKQISKPTANAIKTKAKTSPFLRNKILVPGAQFYHRIETTFRLRLLNMGKTKKVTPLDEEMAVELGADMLGETVVFTVGALIIYAEYRRQVRAGEKKEDFQNERLQDLEAHIQELELTMAKQTTEIKELSRIVLALHSPKFSNAGAENELPKKIVDSNTGRTLIVTNDQT